MHKIQLFIIFLISGLFFACENDQGSTREQPSGTDKFIRVQGKTMGTTYNITYGDSLNRNLKSDIDGLLAKVNNEVSTYEDQSTITRVNRAGESITLEDLPNDYFVQNFMLAKKVFQSSEQSFDPTVMPLVNYWGFGTEAKRAVTRIDSVKIDSLKAFVGFDKVSLSVEENAVTVEKTNSGIALDFSACAKGGGVDAIGAFFKSKGIENYLIDIGGELIANGKSPRGKDWAVGISVPREDARIDEIHTIVTLSNTAVATSGNHRNYYQVEGQKYGHTINPKTGFPEKNDLLSATVFAQECMLADAYATAFMVMGLERAVQLAEQIPEIEAFFIYGKEDGSMGVSYTSGAEQYLKKNQ